MCYIDIDDYCEVWCESDRKARKPHRCSCCYRTIEPGETYVSHFSIFDGEKTINKMCFECERDRKVFADAHDGTLFAPDFMPVMFMECISDDEDDEADAKWGPMLTRIEASRKTAKAVTGS